MSVKLLKIGRGKNNDIVISHPSVSGSHAELFIDEDGRVFITDLNSLNGTTINGVRLKESKILNPDDIVKLGNAAPLPWKSYFGSGEAFKAPPESEEIGEQPAKENNAPSKLWLYLSIAAVLAIGIIIGGVFLLKNYNSENNSPTRADSDVNDKPKTQLPNDTINQIDNPSLPAERNKTISYDYSCMNADLITEGSDLETEIINMSNVTVSLKEERKVGNQLYNACIFDYTFLKGAKLKKIKSIKNKLVNQIQNPRGFNYEIYLIKDSEINAFTAGGFIFVTTGMYDFVRNDDELACVIGHEIAHNERKHINLQLKRQKATTEILSGLSDIFSDAADALTFMVSTPFNQKKETESDFYGIDYATRAGYNSCESINLWQRMSEQEDKLSQLEQMTQSHPPSIERSNCCKKHIQNNYELICN
jgi:beta-barrel assembly-enhancing protease